MHASLVPVALRLMVSPVRRSMRLAAALLLVAFAATGQDAAGQNREATRQKPEQRTDELDIPPSSPKVAQEDPPGALITLIRNTARDQKALWTSPFRMNRDNAKYWVGFGLATGGLVALDRTLARQLPNTDDQARFSKWVSQSGATYTLYPIAGAFYLAGVLADSLKAKEVGALGGEALTDALIISTVLKAVTARERPEKVDGNGNWGRWGNYSFPSGHSIMGWTLASVIAHEYHNRKIVPIAAYGLATTVSLSRFAARKHWASDILAGGAMGWFIGRYVYRRRSDPSIHTSPIARWKPDEFGPVVNARTASIGLGFTWNLGHH